jgi:DNA-binding beta-propeller fold protein YncE
MRRQISTPYGMAIDPIQGVLYITDSGNGTNPGTVSAFDSDQKMKWTRTATAGFFPGHLALYYPYRD